MGDNKDEAARREWAERFLALYRERHQAVMTVVDLRSEWNENRAAMAEIIRSQGIESEAFRRCQTRQNEIKLTLTAENDRMELLNRSCLEMEAESLLGNFKAPPPAAQPAALDRVQ